MGLSVLRFWGDSQDTLEKFMRDVLFSSRNRFRHRPVGNIFFDLWCSQYGQDVRRLHEPRESSLLPEDTCRRLPRVHAPERCAECWHTVNPFEKTCSRALFFVRSSRRFSYRAEYQHTRHIYPSLGAAHSSAAIFTLSPLALDQCRGASARPPLRSPGPHIDHPLPHVLRG